MAVVSYVANDQAVDKIRSLFEGIEQKGRQVPNVLRAMAHSPGLLQGFLAINAALGRTELDGKLRELAYIKTSELNGCDYCLHHHLDAGQKAGLIGSAASGNGRICEQRRVRRASARCDAVCRGSDPAHQRRRPS